MVSSRRQNALIGSIQSALFRDPRAFKKTGIGRILAFFSIFYVRLIRHSHDSFWQLRNEIWDISDDEYRASFRERNGKLPLEPMGDLGFSGSVRDKLYNRTRKPDTNYQTFFATSDSKFLVKSLPRHFEHSFFRCDLFEPYYEYMRNHPDSCLIWITDYVYAPYITLGRLFGTSPAHHIIMTNTFSGRDGDPARDEWEKYDLKPIDYFYPERDLVPDPLVSEDTMNRLADKLDDKIRISRNDYEGLKATLEADTRFLCDANAVDYSLLLVRFPASSQPGAVGRLSPWRVGVPSVDGKWKYRLVLLDFFWAKHRLHAQAMTGVVQTFNAVGHKGPMTITTTADEYREKFLEMVDSLIEVH